jgi:aryl-alcohol dehydrogenase
VAVFGAGVVGLSAVMAAAMLPVSTIVVVDVQDSRLEVARTLGATHVVNSRTEDARKRITEITGGGPQYLVESSGVPAVLAQAIQSLAIGGTAAVVGVPPFGLTAPIDVADMVNGSKRVVGVVEGRGNPPVFLPRLAVLVATGRLPVETLVGTFALEDLEKAAEAMKAGTTIKPVLVPA